MSHGRPIALLLLVAATALAVGAAAQGRDQGSPDAQLQPAPSPAASCRVAPAAGWPPFAPDLPAPDLTAFQDYRDGLGIEGTERGAGVTIADIEYEWRATHTELVGRGLPAARPTGLDAEWRAEDHGTAVLAILGGADDGLGVSGLASEARIEPRSPFREDGAYVPTLTVTRAAEALGPGDVLLIELQLRVGGTGPLVPIEYHGPVRDAIAAAVARGVVVVEPAGNGGLDLGTTPGIGTTPSTWLADPADPLHSGALIVAGGGGGLDEAGTPDLRRAGDSNWGARVDLQGYGSAVVTAGRGDASGGAGPDSAYTACFNGTSSAAATVAGAVAVLQGAAIARTGAPLTPAEVRDLLVSTGTPQADLADGWIGPRPDVAAAIAALPPPEQAAPPPADPTPAAPPATGSAPAPPPPAASPPVVPAPPAATATATARTISAARGLRARVDRRSGAVRLTFAGLAPRAEVRVSGRRVVVRRGVVALRGVPRRARLVVRVAAPRRARVVHRTSAFRVVIPARGAPRVVRLR